MCELSDNYQRKQRRRGTNISGNTGRGFPGNPQEYVVMKMIVIKRLLLTSDPFISSNRTKPSKKKTAFSKEALNLLQSESNNSSSSSESDFSDSD